MFIRFILSRCEGDKIGPQSVSLYVIRCVVEVKWICGGGVVVGRDFGGLLSPTRLLSWSGKRRRRHIESLCVRSFF